MVELEDIFYIPVRDKYLVYAPLKRVVALVNLKALRQIKEQLQTDSPALGEVESLLERLRLQGEPIPVPRTGTLDDPLFLGIIPTRGCNLACRYCDFAAPKQTSPVMDIQMVKNGVDAYLDLLTSVGKKRAEIHFFGGEPFYAEKVVHFAVEYARLQGAAAGIKIHFEAATNGIYNEARCRWIANQFDTIVLSLDGPADIQNCHRPAINGKDAFNIVTRSAHIFSESPLELIIRACVTSDTVERLPEIAQWISKEFRPSAVCFETLKESSLSREAGFEVPTPLAFARNFINAAQILERSGIEAVFSTADLRNNRASFCPVGKDALIISPDGTVDACYLLPEDWKRSGLNMQLGQLNGASFEFDWDTLQQVRQLVVQNKPLCTDCFCRYHCAGGCHITNATSGLPGQYESACVQTRLVTIALLLREIGQEKLVEEWLSDSEALAVSAHQSSDRLFKEAKK